MVAGGSEQRRGADEHVSVGVVVVHVFVLPRVEYVVVLPRVERVAC